MWETREVELVLDLPPELADDVEKVREKRPDLLQRIILYGLTRRVVYEELERSVPGERMTT